MASLIGAHFSRNGIKQFPARVVLSMYGNGIGGDETTADTIVILRDTRIFPSGEAPPDFHTFDPETSGVTWAEYGRYWHSERTEQTVPTTGGPGFRNFKEAWDASPPADYYTICNEQGGGEGPEDEIRANLTQLVKIERAISQAANADGRKCCLLNLAGGSPGNFELWKEIVAPFIVESWQNGGNIYGRHVYADDFVDAQGNVKTGQPQRVIDELEYLQSIGYGGGVVLTECGLDGGYGIAGLDRFTFQIQAWEAALRPYADILIGFCWWECGDTGFHADYTEHLKTLIPYMNNSYLGRWEPPTTQPPDGGEGEPVTTYKNLGDSSLIPAGATHVRIGFRKRENVDSATVNLKWRKATDYIPIPADSNDVMLVWFKEEEEPGNPNPPDPQPPPEDSEYRPLVIDVSHWQGVIDFATMAAQNVRAVMIKATEGETWVDPDFADNWSNAGPHFGDLRMPYHFYRFGADPIKQADHFVDTVINIAGSWAAAFVVDIEDTNTAAKRDDLKLFLDLVEYRTGFVPLIYTASWWWVPRLGGTTWANNYGLIEAEYQFDGTDSNKWPITINDAFLDKLINPTIAADWQEWEFWQFTSKGNAKTFGATSSYIDVQIYNGTLGELKALLTRPSTIDKPPTPPSGPTYDILDYMVGTHRQQHTLQYTWAGGGTQTIQIVQDGNEWRYVKGGGQYEQLYYDDNWIYRAEDTSESADRFYTQSTDGTLGAAWVKRRMAIGETVYTTKQVQHYLKAGCAPQNGGLVTDALKLTAVYPAYTFDSGIVLKDVIRLEWAAGEGYLFAKGYGLVGFEFSGGKSYISELALQGRDDLPVNVPSCLDLSGRYYV